MEWEGGCFWLGVAKWYFVISMSKALSSIASIKNNSNYQVLDDRIFCGCFYFVQRKVYLTK